MSKDGWGARPTDDFSEQVATLAWLILHHSDDGGFNLYEEPVRLVSGGDNPGWKFDADFWLDQTRGSSAAQGALLPDPWPHTASGTTTPYRVVRTARIPYLIRKKGQTGNDEAQTHYLDHILVGYTREEGIATGVSVFNWKKNDGNDNLRKLGRFLAADLWPDSQKIRRVEKWHLPRNSASNPHGVEASDDYGTNQPTWQFRELAIKVDKSVRITMGVGSGTTTNVIRHLLIGYEGGGAW
jgi:hypothetical protein